MQLVVIVRTLTCILQAPGLGHKKKQSSRVNSNYFTLLLILDGITLDYMDNSFLIDFFVLEPSHNNLLPILVFENSNALLILTQLFYAIQ